MHSDNKVFPVLAYLAAGPPVNFSVFLGLGFTVMSESVLSAHVQTEADVCWHQFSHNWHTIVWTNVFADMAALEVCKKEICPQTVTMKSRPWR